MKFSEKLIQLKVYNIQLSVPVWMYTPGARWIELDSIQLYTWMLVIVNVDV